MTRDVLSILRQAVEPMTTRDIALEMLVTRALNTEDQKLLALMVKRVGVALRLQRNNGIVRSTNGPGAVHALGDRVLEVRKLLGQPQRRNSPPRVPERAHGGVSRHHPKKNE